MRLKTLAMSVLGTISYAIWLGSDSVNPRHRLGHGRSPL
jgi:hypothetical protein